MRVVFRPSLPRCADVAPLTGSLKPDLDDAIGGLVADGFPSACLVFHAS